MNFSVRIEDGHAVGYFVQVQGDKHGIAVVSLVRYLACLGRRQLAHVELDGHDASALFGVF